MQNRKYQIAIVDDDQLITTQLKIILEVCLGCETESFNDPSEALERLHIKKFDIISLDHVMPKLTGMDLVKLLRTTPGPNQYTSIVLLTGFREDIEYSHLEILDEVLFQDKPINEKRYIRLIKLMLKSVKKIA